MDLEIFLDSYIETALWSSNDESDPDTGGDPLDRNYGRDDVEAESEEVMRRECASFLWIASGLLQAAEDHPGYTPPGEVPDAFDHAAHDFWLTRNGHGVGFWEAPDWPEEIGSVLDDISKAFGESHLYVGDDNLIHCGW